MIRLDDIKYACADAWGVSLADMMSWRQKAAIQAARQCYYVLARLHTGETWGAIGRGLGREHSHAIDGDYKALLKPLGAAYSQEYRKAAAHIQAEIGCGWLTSLRRYPGPSPMEASCR